MAQERLQGTIPTTLSSNTTFPSNSTRNLLILIARISLSLPRLYPSPHGGPATVPARQPLLRLTNLLYPNPSSHHLKRPTVRYQPTTPIRSPWIESLSSNDLRKYKPLRPSNHDGLSFNSQVPPVPTRNANPSTTSKSTFLKHSFSIGGPNPFHPAPPTLNSAISLPHLHPNESHSSFVSCRPTFNPFHEEDEAHCLDREVPTRNAAVTRGIKRLLAGDNDYDDCVEVENEQKEWDIILYPTFSTAFATSPIPKEETKKADWHCRHRGTEEMAMAMEVEGKTFWELQKRNEEEMNERIERERERKWSPVVNERAREIFLRERRMIWRESSPDPHENNNDDTFDDFPICEMSIAMG
ncbi:hypothetical protein H0H93_000349 [Arthromyces matolae]|nr:hypothetical protein H0H93_000349 [Arthromyces matolae]